MHLKLQSKLDEERRWKEKHDKIRADKIEMMTLNEEKSNCCPL